MFKTQVELQETFILVEPNKSTCWQSIDFISWTLYLHFITPNLEKETGNMVSEICHSNYLVPFYFYL